jgi:alkanesulfonate monooxygenase SsuD/methylene tetrahydromethanopterin reductase-like flavin-dependent oxidoreductase (luciferase family)
VTVASESQALAFARQAGSPARLIEQRTRSLIKGTPAAVHAELSALQQAFGIDEFIIDTPIAEGAARIASLRLLAEGIANYATENESA